ncbi:MAG: hypothetical protein K2Q03_06660 [Sphingobacteriaceae bacterium]|nr:hypothetical protein [Sphingobacteriaceae bacterium]
MIINNKISFLRYHQKIELNNIRRLKIINYLSLVQWSTANNITNLIQVLSLQYSRRLLDRMSDDLLVSKNKFVTNTGYRTVYTLTKLAYLELGLENKKNHLPRISIQSFMHNEKVQQLHIAAINNNIQWITEHELIQTKQYKSYPDGLIISDSLKISIELQRNRYNLESLKSKIVKCLADCLSGKFSKVLFVCVDNLNAEVMRNALCSVTILKGKNHQNIHFSDEYKSYFEFVNFDEFQNYLLKLV